jgi:hypothetical protein
MAHFTFPIVHLRKKTTLSFLWHVKDSYLGNVVLAKNGNQVQKLFLRGLRLFGVPEDRVEDG